MQEFTCVENLTPPMEPTNYSPHLDYTRLLFNKKTRNNSKLNSNSTTSLTTPITTIGTVNNGPSLEALELMKTLLTSQFENEIMETCDKYMELFQKAAGNILANQGEEIHQISLNSILQAMLKSTRSAVTRRYSSPNQLSSTSRGRKVTRRTIKVARHKPRTLQNLKMEFYKHIRAKGCHIEVDLDDSRAENPGDVEGETFVEIRRHSSPVIENQTDTVID